MKALRSLFRRKNMPDGGLLECAAGASPSIRYVNMMLYEMFQNGVDTKILRQSEAMLPIADGADQPRPPALDTAINRLKIMAGLNPMTYAKPVEGSIQLTIGRKECRILCRFDDSADDRCTIRMERKDTAQPASYFYGTSKHGGENAAMKINNDSKYAFNIEPANPPNDGILFVDHSKAGRSGHLGHALVEYAPGHLLAFYPNCSDANNGHTGDGWMEYKRSTDGGRTWGDSALLEYSKRVYDSDQGRSVMCEKAICTNDGDIILFNLECANIVEKNFTWQPLAVPTFLRSSDGGSIWDDAKPMGDEPGRIWDVLYHQGIIYVLELCNDSSKAWYGNLPEHHYSLYVSEDDGRTFTRRSTLPLNIIQRGYGTLAFLPGTGLIAYVYNQTDEKHLDYVISGDTGHTWSEPQTAFFAKQIRNPQMTRFMDGFVMHGRSGSNGEEDIRGHFVLYASTDGVHWDEGMYLQMRTAGAGAYSNNVLVHDPDGLSDRLLIQASHAYEKNMTNIHHWWLS